MNQQSVDDLLAQVQADTSAVAADAGVASSAGAGGGPLEIDGEMEAPPGAVAAAPAADESGLAGEFAPPPSMLAAGASSEYRRLLAIEVPVIVRLGQRRMTVGEVMRVGVGAILEFHKPSDEELELLVNNKSVGKGHAVKVGENFGIRITKVGPLRETIRKLGALG